MPNEYLHDEYYGVHLIESRAMRDSRNRHWAFVALYSTGIVFASSSLYSLHYFNSDYPCLDSDSYLGPLLGVLNKESK